MRILAARGQDPVLIRSRFFYHFSRLFFYNDSTFQIRYKPVVDDGSGTMTAPHDNNTRFTNQNNRLPRELTACRRSQCKFVFYTWETSYCHSRFHYYVYRIYNIFFIYLSDIFL